MCQKCYDAGVVTYIVMVITVAIQVPLVLISFKRASPASDSRCNKFWGIPLSLLAIAGTVYAQIRWSMDCYDEIEKLKKRVIKSWDVDSFSTWENEMTGWSWVASVAGMCAFAVMLLSLLTPVPELYKKKCFDPKTDENLANSLPAGEGSNVFKPADDDSLTIETKSEFV